MSEAIAFDTHRYVKRLMKGGFDELQAETLAAEQVAFLNANLATKSDIARLEAASEARHQETKVEIAKLEASIEIHRQETKSEIEALRQETKGEIETLRQETKGEIARVEAGIEALRQETKGEIARVEASIESLRLATDAKLEAVKGSLIKWMLGIMFAQTTIILAVVSIVVMLPVSSP